ncbi:MAG: polyribonucleotide nucleotidyltransferase [Myxococcota bacterium]
MAHDFNIVTESVDFGGKTLTFETGRMARQASGAVLVTLGETVVLVTAANGGPRPLDFLPLTCDLVEKFYAAGKFPGGFFKREGRPSNAAVLSSRLMDRPIRPLFPEGYKNETQIIATVLSADGENDPALCGLIGASAALHISDIPWNGPIAGCIIGHVDGEFVAVPEASQLEESKCEILVAARKEGLVMVEGALEELSEDQVVEGLQLAADTMKPVLEGIERLREKAGKEKFEFVPTAKDEDFAGKVREIARPLVEKAAFIPEKMERYAAIGAVADQVVEALGEEAAERKKEIKGVVGDLKAEIVREKVLKDGTRIDGRGLEDIRDITCEVDVLPRTHGSALFTRGETQALATITFGTKSDAQKIDTLSGDYHERFMLHYNFPPFSVGEAKFLRSPGRREIGHGTLARRGVLPSIPSEEEFPYTIRAVSEVLESNGSSSMATVCATSMALMQAGVPVKSAVAGIAMGLITDGKDIAVLSDILGDEDHLGDMDFKVVGTDEGITALQMDIKMDSLPWEVLKTALEQARDGRDHILGEMRKSISEPAADLSEHAPRIFTVLINKEKIRDLIGPGGKHIRGIVDATGVQIDVDDDGTVAVAATDGEAAAKAIELIRGYTEDPEIGDVYLGTVVKTVDFGAFIEIMPGKEALCHISELADERVRKTTDVLNEGDEVLVKVIGIDRQGKVKVSRRAALEDQGDE